MVKSKAERLEMIRSLIASQNIASQDTLLGLLAEKGFDVTQATLSRDIKELQIAKIPSADGSYCYKLSAGGVHELKGNAATIPTHHAGISSIEFSGQIAVIKTHPGYANVAAGIIDNHAVEGIMGTLAGDDTVLLILRQGTDKSTIMAQLEALIPNIQDKLI